MYITLENGLILAKSNALTGWKRLQVQRSKICYSSSGCNEYTNPTSSMLVLDKNYLRQGEQQIAVLAGKRNCFVSPNQLQYLDYNYWRQLEFNETIFAISNRTSGTFLTWDLTRAPSNWTDLIIKLNFNCTIGSDINKKLCVLIKLKRSSNYVQTTKSDPGPTAYTDYNATNAGTKPKCTDCTTSNSGLEDVQTTKSDPGPTAYTDYNATNAGTKPKCTEESTNSIATFFVGGAVTLAIVLVVLVVIFIIYKRRRKAPKLSTDVVAVDAVEMQNQEQLQNNQGQGNVIPVGETTPGELGYVNTPIDDETAPYEEVQISPPSHVYAELNRNQRDENDHLYQGLIKRDSDYVIPAHTGAEPFYAEVGKKTSPPGYQELDITKRVQDDSAHYQKLIKK